MPIKKIKYSISHPEGVQVTHVRIDSVQIESDKIYESATTTAGVITAEGEIEVNVVSGKITIEVKAAGSPNRAITYNIEHQGKKLLKEPNTELIVDESGFVRKVFRNVPLNPPATL